MNSADDPLNELLGKKEFGEQTDLRDAVLTQTVPVLRRRRIVRRLGWTMAFAGCYVAGAASLGLWSLQERSTAPLVATNADSAHQSPLAKSQATERSKTRFEALRDAGARALREQGDVETAIRYYSRAIQVATPHDLNISVAHDDWILMSLKQAHSKESNNVGYQDKS